MKLHSITLRNFRAVSDVTLRPALTGITVIEGANEAGKSSISEALNLLLTVKDSSKAARIKDTSPRDTGAGPEVAAEMSSGDFHFTYSKRFLRKSETKLRIDAPVPETLHGDEAHERVRQILHDTMDENLWAALRVEQGSGPEQANFGGQTALSRALDRAAAGQSNDGGDGGDEDLFTRVSDEFHRYYTRQASHPENRELKDQRNKVAALEKQLSELVDEQSRVDHDVQNAERLSRELARQQLEIPGLEVAVSQARAKLDSSQKLLRDCERIEGEQSVAQANAGAAQESLDRRAELISRLKQMRQKRDRVQTDATTSSAILAKIRADSDSASQNLSALRSARDKATKLERAATTALQRFDKARRLTTLTRQLSDWRNAAERLRQSRTFLASCTVTPERLQAAQEAHARHRHLLEQAQTRAPRLTITALAAVDIDSDEQTTSLTSGESLTPKDSSTVTIRDVARLSLDAGFDQAQREQAALEAGNQLQTIIDSLGAPSIGAAVNLLEKRTRHESLADELSEQVKRLLDGKTADQLEDDVARLKASLGDAALAADGGELQQLAVERLAALDAAGDALARAEQAVDEKRTELETRIREKGALDSQVTQLTETIDDLQEQLTEARSRDSDAALSAAVESARHAVLASTAKLDQARNELGNQPIGDVQAGADAAHNALAGAEARMRDTATRLKEVHAALKVREEKGLYEALADARNNLEVARHDFHSLERRANAARLLYETMAQARQLQRQRYLEPLEAQIDRLGKVVFGESFRITLDENLAIVDRTLDGLTLPFNSLSMGAREQLAVIARLAVALCVDDSDGVPLVLDDVLGHADAERLRSMNAVLNLAAQCTQVLILTCYPARYAHLDRAKTEVMDAV